MTATRENVRKMIEEIAGLGLIYLNSAGSIVYCSSIERTYPLIDFRLLLEFASVEIVDYGENEAINWPEVKRLYCSTGEFSETEAERKDREFYGLSQQNHKDQTHFEFFGA